MTECSLETSVPDWIIDHPETFSVFEELGIDMSCGGKSLEYASQQAGLDANAVFDQLRQKINGSHRGEPS